MISENVDTYSQKPIDTTSRNDLLYNPVRSGASNSNNLLIQ